MPVYYYYYIIIIIIIIIINFIFFLQNVVAESSSHFKYCYQLHEAVSDHHQALSIGRTPRYESLSDVHLLDIKCQSSKNRSHIVVTSHTVI